MKDENEIRREILEKLVPKMRTNAIYVIVPYQWNGLWVFDDKTTGLEREPFIAGADTVLDRATESIPDADKGCLCMFSDTPFPKANLELTLRPPSKELIPLLDRKGQFGNVYYCEQFQTEAWLCPALLLYFEKAPKKIYAAVLPLNRDKPTQTP